MIVVAQINIHYQEIEQHAHRMKELSEQWKNENNTQTAKTE